MVPEAPYEVERPLLDVMMLSPVSVAHAARILEVTVPSAQTLLHHLESIGIAWQLPLELRCARTPATTDWDITPHGRAMVRDRLGPRCVTEVGDPHRDPIPDVMARIWAA